MAETDGPKIVELYPSNYRDPVATLRKIADEMEAGEFGPVGCVGVVLMGNAVHVFGAGLDSEPAPVATLLYAGFLRLVRPIEEHGNG